MFQFGQPHRRRDRRRYAYNDLLAVGDFVALPGFGAQHASEVARLLAAQFRHAAAHGIHEESSPGQEIIVRKGKGDRRILKNASVPFFRLC